MSLKNTDIARRLILNALDFLRQAIADFSTKPKYSVINFCSAVELVLKARLLEEHWSLVVAKQTTRKQFEDGDFMSVTFEDSVKKLGDIVGVTLSTEALKSFDSIRKHRNKMVHFFHSGTLSSQEIEVIAAEQLRAWYYLNQLLTIVLRSTFEKYDKEIKEVERALYGHREYLNAKFIDLSNEFSKRRNRGEVIQSCKTCRFNSSIVDEVLENIFQSKCLVCHARHRWMVISCEICKHKTDFESDGESFVCKNQECKETEDLEELVDRLNEEYHKPDEACLAMTPANCGECEGYHVVIEYSGKYVCLNCLDISDELKSCEWCHEFSSGDMEDSYMMGCTLCEGNIGWHKDD